jgi:lysophospholipase L1-like esterase
LRTALVPGVRFRSGPYRIDVNSLGFRGPEIAVPKPPETMRIFALGESSTFGWKGARSHEEAWPGVLETKLRAAHPGRRIEVINAGVPGYTSIEQRINFMLRISHLQPDAILIYHGNNDLNWSWTPEIETKLIYGRADAAVCRPGWFTRLMEFSYVWMEVRSRIELFGASSRPKKDAVDPAALRMLEENIRGLIDDAGRQNVKVAIATFAHGFDVTGQPGHFTADEVKLGVPNVGRWFENLSPEGARRSFPVYNEMVRSLAGTEKIPLAEPIKRIPPTPEYFTDWCHLTLKGEQLMAQIWFETLEEAGWFKSAPPSNNP